MISIVVCSVKEEEFNKFTKSVESTIGVPFEIIKIDNSKNEYGLCAAYNKGKALCKYEIICFSHEDIEFETMNWGNILIDILEDPAIGLVGAEGACYLSLFPIDWIDPHELEGQYIESFVPDKPHRIYCRFPKNSPAEVVATDGFFMTSRKKIMNKINFSDNLLTGFHGYDFDICMQIRQDYKVVVSRDILLSHYSKGERNASYYEAIKKLSKKWKRYLPVHIACYTKKEIKELKIKCLDILCQKRTTKKLILKNNLNAIGYAAKHGILFMWVRKKVKNQVNKFY